MWRRFLCGRREFDTGTLSGRAAAVVVAIVVVVSIVIIIVDVMVVGQ